MNIERHMDYWMAGAFVLSILVLWVVAVDYLAEGLVALGAIAGVVVVPYLLGRVVMAAVRKGTADE